MAIAIVTTAITKWGCSILQAADHAADCCGFSSKTVRQWASSFVIATCTSSPDNMTDEFIAEQLKFLQTVGITIPTLAVCFTTKTSNWQHGHLYVDMLAERGIRISRVKCLQIGSVQNTLGKSMTTRLGGG